VGVWMDVPVPVPMPVMDGEGVTEGVCVIV
jgi:hypothetical protein